MKTNLKFPLFIDLADRKIIIFGGGTIAERRIRTLLAFGAAVKVVAPEMTDEVRRLSDAGEICLETRTYLEGELSDEFLVLAATNDREVNRKITQEAKEKGLYANNASDRTQNSFFFPAVCMTEEIAVGICGTGSDHRKVRETAATIREALESKETKEE